MDDLSVQLIPVPGTRLRFQSAAAVLDFDYYALRDVDEVKLWAVCLVRRLVVLLSRDLRMEDLVKCPFVLSRSPPLKLLSIEEKSQENQAEWWKPDQRDLNEVLPDHRLS